MAMNSDVPYKKWSLIFGNKKAAREIFVNQTITRISMLYRSPMLIKEIKKVAAREIK